MILGVLGALSDLDVLCPDVLGVLGSLWVSFICPNVLDVLLS